MDTTWSQAVFEKLGICVEGELLDCNQFIMDHKFNTKKVKYYTSATTNKNASMTLEVTEAEVAL